MDSLIFDLDGTIWDATETMSKPWTETMRKHGIDKTITAADLASVMGMTVPQLADVFIGDLKSKEERLKIAYEGCDSETPYLKKYGGKLYPDIEKTLCELSKKYKLFIVSNCETDYINAFFEYHGLKKYFTDVEYIGRTGKPKADNIKIIIERHNLKSPAYVGDTSMDFDAATKNSIPFIFASYGFGSCDDYAAKIDTPSELIKICETL